MATYKLGSELSVGVQRECLARFVYRYTKEHKPMWASKEWKDGKPYPVQFASDKDWPEHTRFAVTKNGSLDCRVNHCESHPTWPDGFPK